eukprot:TCONS_00000402-protein
MYQQGSSGYYGDGGGQYHDEGNQNQYGHNYRDYRMNDQSIKGKIEQKYWKTKQKAIEKLGKDQDEFVIAGDAEVDARLEAFQHIKITCMQLMAAIECYQNKIFALSQDENEMGRFLKDQGSLDKTKAGKMMIAVGKAQSFAAQQRLGMRSSLARLYSEIETFRFRAIQDTQLTVTKMETSRSEYRARLLWMADISKELDPDQFKRLDKFRDVQMQVKLAKKKFDQLKGDVIQKIDLLSASRCNLLSATLEPYQSSMVKFLNTTAKSYNTVHEEYKGHPSYKFNILKNIIPNNGIVDDEEDDLANDQDNKSSNKENRRKKKTAKPEQAEEATEEKTSNDDDGDDKLINFDSSPSEDVDQGVVPKPTERDADLLGASLDQDSSPGFGDYTETKDNNEGFEDLLGKFEENNVLADKPSHQPSLISTSTEDTSDPFSFISNLDSDRRKSDTTPPTKDSLPEPSVDDLLFGSPNRKLDGTEKTDLDILTDVLSNQNLGITETEHNKSFSDQWQSMFGAGVSEESTPSMSDLLAQDLENSKSDSTPKQPENMVDANIKSDRMYMPSFLLEQMRKTDPQALKNGPPKGALAVKDSAKASSGKPGKSGEKGKDMSAWFNLFADLDPLANPDDIGDSKDGQSEKQAC